MQKILIAILLAALGGTTASPQTSPQPSSPALEHANQLFQAKDWSAAADAFQAITRSDPSIGLAWLRLGASLHKLEQYQKALEAYGHVLNDPRLGPSAHYRQAAALARMNDKDRAFDALSQAVQGGIASRQAIQDEADFASLHGDPRFQKLLEQAEAAANPCAHQPEKRQFDFWIGEWNVESTQGHVPVGTSDIQLILNQCIIFENWTGAGGGSGKSFNHYDNESKKWIQDWVDARGGAIHFEGGLKDGVMDFYADSHNPDGTPIRRHLQFFNLDQDHVRQFSRQSSDGGKSWSTEYDFTYVRKK